jgi:predicted XRE-type DNA-binding protein
MAGYNKSYILQLMNRPAHVTRGDVFDDLGFSKADAAELKRKARILSALLKHIRERNYTPAKLARILKSQPDTRNILGGRISKLSLEKLLLCAQLLNVEIKLR